MSKKAVAEKVWKKIFPQDFGRVFLLEEWERHGYLCRIVQGKRLDHYCGYVGIPIDHPLVKDEEWDIIERLEVHGGVTFTTDSFTLNDSWEKKLWKEPYFWIGFDCAHAWDYSKVNPKGHKWTLSELKREANRLADQLKEKEKKKNV